MEWNNSQKMKSILRKEKSLSLKNNKINKLMKLTNRNYRMYQAYNTDLKNTKLEDLNKTNPNKRIIMSHLTKTIRQDLINQSTHNKL